MALVIDASVAAAWCFDDEDDERAERAADEVDRIGALVPWLFWFEIRNVLIINERRGRSTPERSAEFLSYLEALNFSVDVDPVSLM